jgi:nucleoside-diphosphate-sugar epimerase
VCERSSLLTPGKRLIRRLLSTQTPITVVDLIFHPLELEEIHQEFPYAASSLVVVPGDIRDKAVMKEALTRDVVGVIHLAAVSRVLWCLENERDCVDVNVRGTEEVLAAMESRGGWFIQASSREVYGDAKSFPVDEETAATPANIYGSTKADAETVIQRHASKSKSPFHAIILRLSNVYGSPADHHERLIPSIMVNALSHRPIQIVGGDQDVRAVYEISLTVA